MFNFFKEKFFNFCNNFALKIQNIFSSNKISDEELDAFFELLVTFDIGIDLSRSILNEIKEKIKKKELVDSEALLLFVKTKFLSILEDLPAAKSKPDVILLFGINGAGKTTTAAKLAYMVTSSKKNTQVLLVAADTFRAAAMEQLKEWGNMSGAELFIGKEKADPASVIFNAGTYANEKNSFELVIIDTAGRLHTNLNLVKELEKSCKVTEKVFPRKQIAKLLVLDSMLGQNSFEQVKIFLQATKLDGIILTKLDSSAKGGVVLAIAKEFKLPIMYVTVAENDLLGIKPFNPKEYVDHLFSK